MRKRSDVKAPPTTPAEERTMPMFEEMEEPSTEKRFSEKLPQDPNDPVEVDEEGDADLRSNLLKKKGLTDSAKLDLETQPFGQPLACCVCNVPLTQTAVGFMPKCGHKQADEGTPVRVVWGEEKYTPIAGSYSTFTVGPFEVTLVCMRGETLAQTWLRGNAQLIKLAEVERVRKSNSFVRALGLMKGEK